MKVLYQMGGSTTAADYHTISMYYVSKIKFDIIHTFLYRDRGAS